MQKPSRPKALLILLSSSLALLGVACSAESPKSNASTKPQPSTVATAPTAKTPVHKKPILAKDAIGISAIDTYELALDKAASAASISQAAQSAEDWKLVSNRWQEAIKLMQAVPGTSPHKAIAKTKLAEYQKNLATAKQNANPPKPEPVVAVNPDLPSNPAVSLPRSNQRVFRVPIKYYLAGTPVIEVTFNGRNGRRKFEMIFDTGASGIVITPRMAAALGVVPVGKMRASTASHKAQEFDVGFVDSIVVGGAVATDMAVAIAPALPDEIGLLGREFSGRYIVTISDEAIEFRVR